MDQPWPDGYLDCVTAATDDAAGIHCETQFFSGKLKAVHDYRPICGGRDVGLRIALPLPLVESLKLAELVLTRPRRDCRGAVVRRAGLGRRLAQRERVLGRGEGMLRQR